VPGVVRFYKNSSADITLAPGGTHTVDVHCDAGDATTGGGYSMTGIITALKVPTMYPLASAYRVGFFNIGTSDITVRAYAICADVTP
jgi:hypothetical protein